MLVPTNGQWQHEDKDILTARSTKLNDRNTDGFSVDDRQWIDTKDWGTWMWVELILYICS